MSAKPARTPRTPATPTPDRETFPITGVSITVTPPSLFTVPPAKPVTFEGEALAAALRWIALTCPAVERFTDPQRVGFELVGIAEQARAIGDADLEMIPADSNALWCSMADRLRDLAYRIAAHGDPEDRMNETVTITRRKAASVAMRPQDASQRPE